MTKAQPSPRRDPVSLVFGPTAPGPFALLGLEASDVGMPQVLAALHRRLDEVNSSPHAATPAAEDVRLALHAAAAQLCDPAVRRLLLGTWSNQDRGSASGSIGEEAHPDARLGLERDLHIAVGLSGGWNASAMQRLALACEARGVGPQELIAALSGLGSSRSGTALRGVIRPAIRSGQTIVVADPKSSVPRELLAVLGIGVGLIVMLVIGLVLVSRPERGSARSEDVVAALSPSSSAASPLRLEETAPKPSAEPAELTISDARSIGRELSSLASMFTDPSLPETDSAALGARFERALESFRTNWHLLRRDEIAAVTTALIDLTFAASQRQRDSEIAMPLLAPLRAPPRDRREVRAIVASAAMASRLMQERDLPRSLLERLESALRANPITREVGPNSRLDLAAEQLVSPLAANLDPRSDLGVWKGFIDVRDAAYGDRVRAKDAATLIAIGSVMRAPADEGGGTEEAVLFLAESLSWNKSPELRTAIAGWFVDAAVPTPRIAALTRAMLKSKLRGIDSTMVLTTSAPAERREEVRGLIEIVLRDESAGVGLEAIRAWVAAADAMLLLSASKPEEQIDLAARLSELVAARQSQLDGQSELASRLITTSNTSTAFPANVPQRPAPGPSAVSKALEYAALGASQAARTDFWKKRLADPGVVDTLLARLALEEAGRGSPATVRDAARDFVRAHAADDAVLWSALDLVFVLPETPENLDWISDIVGRKLAWRGKGTSREVAHRALVEVAAARLSQLPNAAAIDAAADRLARSWVYRTGEVPGDDPLTPSEAVRRLEQHLLRVAAGASDDRGGEGEIRRRLNARLRVAQGPLQAAVWRQAACVEAVAAQASRRNPALADGIRDWKKTWDERRRRALTAFEQMLEGERAVVSVLRLEAMAALASGGGQ